MKVFAIALVAGIVSGCSSFGQRVELPSGARQCSIDRWKGGVWPSVGKNRVKVGDVIEGARVLEINGSDFWIEFEYKGKRLRQSCQEAFSS